MVAIRAAAVGESQSSIGRRMGVSVAQVNKIVRGKSWTHIR